MIKGSRPPKEVFNARDPQLPKMGMWLCNADFRVRAGPYSFVQLLDSA